MSQLTFTPKFKESIELFSTTTRQKNCSQSAKLLALNLFFCLPSDLIRAAFEVNGLAIQVKSIEILKNINFLFFQHSQKNVMSEKREKNLFELDHCFEDQVGDTFLFRCSGTIHQ